MPQNKRESFIYTLMMCFLMVLWMSIYNVSLHMGEISIQVLKQAWLGFPFAYICALCLDWFCVSKVAKGFAFKYLIKPDSSAIKKVLGVSCCMVIPMVFLMSLYGGIEGCLKLGDFSSLPLIWLQNIPKNFVMALPFQLMIAGPLIRKIFRTLFPVGTVL